MATHRKADARLHQLVQQIVDDDFPDLKEAGVTIDVFTAHAPRGRDGEPRGHALKHHGYPAEAIAEIHSHKRRVGGEADCRITVDGDNYESWSDVYLESVLAHELMHFEVCRTKPKFRKRKGLRVQVDPGGQVITDDCCRPKLRIRKHDRQIGVFTAIAERYGAESADFQAVAVLADATGQLLFPWTPPEFGNEKRRAKRQAAAV